MKSMLFGGRGRGVGAGDLALVLEKGSPLPTAEETDEAVTQATAMPATYVRIWRFMSMLLFRIVGVVSAARPFATITSS